MKRFGMYWMVLAVVLLSWQCGVNWAQNEAGQAGLKSLGIGDVKIAKALAEVNTVAGKKASLARVAQALDGQLINRFAQTRKFRIVARSDLDALLQEQGFVASGNVDSNDKSAAQSFQIKGVEYLLVTSIDDFQDLTEEATFQSLGEKAIKRTIRISVIGKLYQTTTGELLESTNQQVEGKGFVEQRGNTASDGDTTDALLLQTARTLADRMANRVVDVIYPARIIAVSGSQVTINRGDGTGIAAGQTWVVHQLGPMMVDPDTGVALGREEVMIGKVRVSSVEPKFSKAEIVSGNQIQVGGLLRME